MKILKLLSGLFTIAALAACSDNNSENIYVKDDAILSNLSQKSISFEYDGSVSEGSSSVFTVNCAAVPSVTASDDWIIVNRTGSANKVHTYSVTVSANELAENRNGFITLKSGKSEENITVTQSSAPSLPDSSEPQPLLGINASDIAKDYIAGWNIGNTLEACNNETHVASEEMWGNPKINQTYIDGVKDAGFNFIRIPCAWDYYIIDANYTIDPKWLARVNEVVGMIVDRDMYAIVNIHWDGGWLENNIGKTSKPELINKQKVLWTQIAKALGHYNERLLFAGLNEPNADDEASSASLLEYEQAFVDAVRATGGNNEKRTLIFQGPSTNIEHTYNFFKKNPTDPAGDGYMMAEVHYYSPYQYCLMENDADWSPVYWFWGNGYHVEGSNRNATWGEEDYMKDQFDMMKNQFVSKNIPVILGEFGAYPNEHEKSKQTDFDKEKINESRAYYYRCVMKFGKERGILPFVWDTGELISRQDGSIRIQWMIDAIMGGANSATLPY